MTTQFADIYLALRDFAAPLLEKFAGTETLEYLFYRYGWRVSLDEPTFQQINQVLGIKTPLEQFLQSAELIQHKLDDAPGASVSAQDLAALVQSATPLIDALVDFKLSALTALSGLLGDPAFWQSIGAHLLDDLLEEYLRIYHPNLYLVLHFWGGIRYEPMQPAAPFRRPYTRVVFDWQQVLAMVREPLTALKHTYKWGDPTAPFEHQRLFETLANVLRAIHLPTERLAPALQTAIDFPPTAGHRLQRDVDALKTLFVSGFSPRDDTVYDVGLGLYPAVQNGASVASGLLLSPILRGGAEGALALSDDVSLRWKAVASADGVIGLALFPDTLALLQGQLAVGASVELAGTRTEPWYLFGNARTSRIEIANPSLRLAIEGTADAPEARLRLSTTTTNGQAGCKVVVLLDDADGFVKDTVKQRTLEVSFAPEVIWSSKTGLTFNGKPNVDLDIPLNLSLGPVRVQHLVLRLAPKNDGNAAIFALEASAGLQVSLGPVVASIDRMGFLLELDFERQKKNLGVVDLSFGFKPPNGIGLAINASQVVGGGYLFYDPQQGQYAGVAQLEIQDLLSVKALGLLSTKLPDGGSGYSLLLIVTAEGFRPIPLGFGFMLTGIGGLLGVHRTANTAALQAGVRNRTLDAILFPKNLLTNAPQYLSTLNTVFPPARDHFLFGLAAQITWGTPTLVTINLALILELGAATKLLILGQLSALLPSSQNDLVRLKMDAIGIIDFDQRTASLDARLYDSRLAKQFAISGDMAMRMRWGQQPSFALAVGGFHPAFTPPAGFPALERSTISLANSENLQIRCEAYLAITSNTVQFGSRSELLAKAGQAALHGEIGYDVLVQFDPFHFIAAFHASVQIKYRGRNLLRVALQGELSGPRPLRVRGKATFEILWFDVSVSFDHVLVSGVKPPLPAPVEVLPHLQEALRQPASWQAVLPGARLVTLRESAAPDTVTLHPLSTLSVRQNVVPLNLRITRFGNTRPSGAQEFRIQQVAIGGQPAAVQGEPLREFFAPAQFREMSDDEKLSAPAFQALPAGVQFGSGSLRHGSAVGATLEAYEEYIIPQPANAPQSGQVQTTADLLTRFGHLSAVGSNAVRRTGRNKYQAKPITIASTDKVYALTSTRDLAATTAQHATWTEASAALWHLRNTDPEQARDLQIVTV